MTTAKKVSLAFMAVINLVNLAAGIICVVKMLTGGDVLSVIPIKSDGLTVVQILLINFAAVMVLTALISIVTSYLATDVAYTPIEILSNCSIVFLVLPIIIFVLFCVCAYKADISADKIWIVLSGLGYLVLNSIDISCLLTVRYDANND